MLLPLLVINDHKPLRFAYDIDIERFQQGIVDYA